MDESSPSNGGQELGNTRWRLRERAFRPFSQQNEAQALRVVVRKPLVTRLTKDIVETYQICNPQFKFSEDVNPKLYLTTPSVGVLNDGYDNANSDLILSVNYGLVNLETQQRLLDMLGCGNKQFCCCEDN